MKAYWIDRETNTAKVVETDGSLKSIYKMCHCRCIDIACRNVGGFYLDFFVDDEGLLVENPKATVFDHLGNPMLAGSVVVLASDEEGGTIGLTDEQVRALEEATRNVQIFSFRTGDVEERVVVIAEY